MLADKLLELASTRPSEVSTTPLPSEACVSVLPAMVSVYRWQGAVEQAQEMLLLAKTAADRVPALIERLQALHPYELPEIVAVQAAAGLPAYLDWVADSTRP